MKANSRRRGGVVGKAKKPCIVQAGPVAMCLSVAALVAACGGRVSVRNDAPVVDDGGPSSTPSTRLPTAGDGEPDSTPSTRVPSGSIATFGPDRVGIVVFPPRPTANTAPLAKFDGDWETQDCVSLAFDRAGFLYNLCFQFDSTYPPTRVLVFDASAGATRDPVRTLTGPSTGLDERATNIAVDAKGYVYVVRDSPGSDGSVLVFAPGADGDEAPVRTISGPKTGLDFASTLAVDASRNLYVGIAEGGPILVFPPDADGDVAPARGIGAFPDIQSVGSLFVANDFRLFVGNQQGNASVLVYDAGAAVGAPPVRTIAGSATQVATPSGLVVDGEGNIAVSVWRGTDPGFLEFFPANASGNVAPSVTLPSLGGVGIAIAP